MSKKKTSLLVLTGCAALAALGLRAHAEGAPTVQPLWYAGTVSEGGTPLTGNHQVWLRLYMQESGASPALCTSGPATVPFDGGRFRVELKDECTELMRQHSDLFVELSVDDDQKPFPRSKIGAVPYALEAAHAQSASNATGALKQSVDKIPVITAWQDFTPQLFVGAQAATPVGGDARGKYRRVGDTLELQFELRGTGLPSSGRISFPLPEGLTPDFSKLVNFATMGQGTLYSPALQALWELVVEVDEGTKRLQLVFNNPTGTNASAAVASSAPFDLTTGFSMRFAASVPVSGWEVTTP